MHNEMVGFLNEVHFEFNECGLKECVNQHKKRPLTQGLVEYSGEIAFYLSVNHNKAIVASIVVNDVVNQVDEENIIQSGVETDELSFKETIFLDGVRQTNEFGMVVETIG